MSDQTELPVDDKPKKGEVRPEVKARRFAMTQYTEAERQVTKEEAAVVRVSKRVLDLSARLEVAKADEQNARLALAGARATLEIARQEVATVVGLNGTEEG